MSLILSWSTTSWNMKSLHSYFCQIRSLTQEFVCSILVMRRCIILLTFNLNLTYVHGGIQWICPESGIWSLNRMCALDLKRKLPGLNLVNVLPLDPTSNLFNAATWWYDTRPQYLLMSMMINTMDDGKMKWIWNLTIKRNHHCPPRNIFGAKIWGSGQGLLDPYGTF